MIRIRVNFFSWFEKSGQMLLLQKEISSILGRLLCWRAQHEVRSFQGQKTWRFPVQINSTEPRGCIKYCSNSCGDLKGFRRQRGRQVILILLDEVTLGPCLNMADPKGNTKYSWGCKKPLLRNTPVLCHLLTAIAALLNIPLSMFI